MGSAAGNPEIRELIANADLFKALDDADLDKCAACFREARFAKGEMLFSRGDPGAHLYIVGNGQIRLAIATEEGRELSFQIVGRGGMFGEIAVLDGLPRSAEALALTPTTVLRIDRKDFDRLRAANPAISEAVIAFLCRRLRDVSDKLEAIALYPLEIRLARFLLVALRGRPDIPGRRLALDLQYSQGELALLLGASRPKINAALGSLEDAEALRRTSDRLFCDRAKLAAIAQTGEAP
jgi:CRP-like cAMP-binding protein